MKKIILLLFFSLQLSAQKKPLTPQQLHKEALRLPGDFFRGDFSQMISKIKVDIDTFYMQVKEYSDVKVITIAYDAKSIPDAYFFYKNDTCTYYTYSSLEADMPRIQSEIKGRRCVYDEKNKFWYSDAVKLYYTLLPLPNTMPQITEVTYSEIKPEYPGKPIIKTQPSLPKVEKAEPPTKKNTITKNTPAPKTYSYYIASGLKKFDVKNYMGSVNDNTKAIQIDPLNDSAYINRAVSKVFLKDSLNSAIADLSKALALNTPRAAHVYHVRGLLKGNLEDYLGAELDFFLALGEEDITYDLKITCYVDRARACIALKNYPQAVADYGSAIELNPTNADYYNKRGNARALNEDLDGACIDWYLAKDLGSTEAVKSFKNFCK